MRNFLLCHLFWIFLFPFTLSGEPSSEEPEIELEREYEVGLRGGIGYRGDDRLSNALENYKSYSAPGIYGNTYLSPFSITRNLEAYARTRWSNHTKVGFLLGSGNFPSFHLQEFNTYPEMTRIHFKLGSDYLFLTYHYEWLFKRFSVEGGIGLGINNTELSPSGFTWSRFGYSELNGFMTANGLSYRLELGVKKLISDRVYLETGCTTTMHTAPYFNGSFNDSLGSYYVKSDGTLDLLTNSEFQDSITNTSLSSRKLDMVYSVFQVYIGLAKRFSL